MIVDPQRDFVDKDGALFVAGIDDPFCPVPSPGECIDNIIQLGMLPFGHVTITLDKHPEVHVEHTIFPEPQERKKRRNG